MGGRIKGKRDKDREKDKRKRGKNSDGLKDGDTGSMTESHREAKGTESRTALAEKNNCDGQWERDVEKGKILRKRERRERTGSWMGGIERKDGRGNGREKGRKDSETKQGRGTARGGEKGQGSG